MAFLSGNNVSAYRRHRTPVGRSCQSPLAAPAQQAVTASVTLGRHLAAPLGTALRELPRRRYPEPPGGGQAGGSRAKPGRRIDSVGMGGGSVRQVCLVVGAVVCAAVGSLLYLLRVPGMISAISQSAFAMGSFALLHLGNSAGRASGGSADVHSKIKAWAASARWKACVYWIVAPLLVGGLALFLWGAFANGPLTRPLSAAGYIVMILAFAVGIMIRAAAEAMA
jgi:hypothetical protein